MKKQPLHFVTQLGVKRYAYDLNKKAPKMYALLSCEINQYKCFTGEEILPPEQSKIIEQNNFNYTSLRKTKNTKE